MLPRRPTIWTSHIASDPHGSPLIKARSMQVGTTLHSTVHQVVAAARINIIVAHGTFSFYRLAVVAFRGLQIDEGQASTIHWTALASPQPGRDTGPAVAVMARSLHRIFEGAETYWTARVRIDGASRLGCNE